jgi:transcriptional regulator with XRE-family HTH domain
MMRSNVSRIESAKHQPTLETLEKIAKALKVTVADLVARR